MALGSDRFPRNRRGDLRGEFRLPALAFPGERGRAICYLPCICLKISAASPMDGLKYPKVVLAELWANILCSKAMWSSGLSPRLALATRRANPCRNR